MGAAPSPSPSPCNLLNGVELRSGAGLSGSFANRARPTAAAWSAASTCPGGGLATIFAAPAGTDVYSIDLEGYPVGGSLVISSCPNPAYPGTMNATGDNALSPTRHVLRRNRPFNLHFRMAVRPVVGVHGTHALLYAVCFPHVFSYALLLSLAVCATV